MAQLSFGTNKALRDEAYKKLAHSGQRPRRFTLTGQVIHGQYVGTVYYVDYDDRYALEDVDEEVAKLSRQAQSTLPKSPMDSIIGGRPRW